MDWSTSARGADATMVRRSDVVSFIPTIGKEHTPGRVESETSRKFLKWRPTGHGHGVSRISDISLHRMLRTIVFGKPDIRTVKPVASASTDLSQTPRNVSVPRPKSACTMRWTARACLVGPTSSPGCRPRKYPSPYGFGAATGAIGAAGCRMRLNPVGTAPRLFRACHGFHQS